ncbi:MAG: insulinase family protein [Thermicanus sp.]|nr:insulinase family protein [Thermicanus sp.]
MPYDVDQVIHGFLLQKKAYVEEIKSEGLLFEHKKSGARLLVLLNDDENKVFSITFRTPPASSNGLPHILEHSVLNGSRKYHVKEPFVELAKGSLNTFLNAMTFSDKTMYPVASMNDKDFRNLMDVYLDAVFYPNLVNDPEILKQEGWHYELKEPDGEITYRGVVYNEMKGAFSSPESVLFRKIQESLFPDTPYHFESGGDPDVIPTLTQEEFVSFHRTYYHPSNSYLFLYGKLNLEEQLEYLDQEYLSHFDRKEIDSAIPLQKPFSEQREVKAEYSISSNEKERDKSFLSLNFAVGTSTDEEKNVAFDILEYMLLETPAAPLKKALIEAGLGKDVFGSYDSSIRQPVFSIVVKNTNPEEKERFQQVVWDTLKGLVKNGIDKELVESAINRKEFTLREADARNYPKGLIYNIQVFNSWLYDEDPLPHLQYEQPLSKIKEGAKNRYFETLIEKDLLNNPHRTLFLLAPKKGLEEEKAKETREKLKAYKASLTEEERRELVQEGESLLKRQITPDDPEQLAKIPLLSLEDVRKEAEIPATEERQEGNFNVLYHPQQTNKITYVNLYFDLAQVDQGLLPYTALLAGILSKISTENNSYEQLSNEINLHTGGIQFATGVYQDHRQESLFQSKFIVRGKALTDKVPKLIKLIEEILFTSRYDEEKRLKELLEETKSRMEMALYDRGHMIAATRLLSYFSPGAKVSEETGGIAFYHFVSGLLNEWDGKKGEVSRNLKKVAESLFTKENLLISVTGGEAEYKSVAESLPALEARLKEGERRGEPFRFQDEKGNEGLMTAAKVQYVAKGYNFKKLGYDYTGSMQVLKTILNLDYLWNKVRVQGGAYGNLVGIDRNGNIYFASYRDPNLEETLKAYDEMVEYVRNFQADEREMTKYILGTISRLDTPLSPSMKGEKGDALYFSGLTKEEVQKERDEILSTTVEKIRQFADLLDKVLNEKVICVLGNEEKIRANQAFFNRLVQVLD